MNLKFERINHLAAFAMAGNGKIVLVTANGSFQGTPYTPELSSDADKQVSDVWNLHVKDRAIELPEPSQKPYILLKDVTVLETNITFESLFIFYDQVIAASLSGDYNFDFAD
ncbi:hypothetical protein [Weissella confusa]|uniref:hypothetical protein n=1 Tax=Weissella confusa TaxID=1583 RepID=UPI0010804B6F|nr:hypothetical protein [Weissella confusa]MBJ7628186.1 hypothetical protein [Weissella confusa]TGE49196.1 hypothetical protein C6P23_03585 [Weissella confusa]